MPTLFEPLAQDARTLRCGRKFDGKLHRRHEVKARERQCSAGFWAAVGRTCVTSTQMETADLNRWNIWGSEALPQTQPSALQRQSGCSSFSQTERRQNAAQRMLPERQRPPAQARGHQRSRPWSTTHRPNPCWRQRTNDRGTNRLTTDSATTFAPQQRTLAPSLHLTSRPS